MKPATSLVRFSASLLLLPFFAAAVAAGTGQNIVVDAAPSHVVNSFSPFRALGSAAERAQYVGVLDGENTPDCRRRYGESVLEVCRCLDRPKPASVPAVRAVPVQEMTICDNVVFLESYRSCPRQTLLDVYRSQALAVCFLLPVLVDCVGSPAAEYSGKNIAAVGALWLTRNAAGAWTAVKRGGPWNQQFRS
jgi:hypothetical protein